MNPFFTEYSEYLGKIFPGIKVQKISVNTGAGCPNRDGRIGSGGCIYCNNMSFTPAYCFGISGISGQLEAGKRFFGKKYPEMKYLAYFQSFTSTYNPELFNEALKIAASCKDVVGIVVGTRPDCLPADIMAGLRHISQIMPVLVELGVESLHDSTLRKINRGHDSGTAIDAINRLADNGLHPGVHLIAGLPGENEEMFLETVDKIASLPVETVKFHQLQILKGSTLGNSYLQYPDYVRLFTLEEYLDLCMKIVSRLPRRIAIDRFLSQSPPNMVIAPQWGIKNHEFTAILLRRLKNLSQ